MLVAWLLLIGSCQTTEGGSRYLECTHHMRCSEVDRVRWFELTEHARNLVELGAVAREDGYIIESTKLRRSLRHRDYLCAEYRASGFLLYNESNYNWPVACMWVGGEMNATCGLIPPTEKPFGYLEPREWHRLLFALRKNIGCSDDEINAIRKVPELFYCTERCIQAGIGYLPLMLIMGSVILSFFLFCFS